MENHIRKAGATFSRPFTVKLPTGMDWRVKCDIVDSEKRKRASCDTTLVEQPGSPGVWNGSIFLSAVETAKFQRPCDVGGFIQLYYDLKFYLGNSTSVVEKSQTYGLRIIWDATQ